MWSYGFAFEHGQEVKCLTVADDSTRGSVAISTLLITHSLTNDKIVGKTKHKTNDSLNRCAS
jgi:hypothetical protein